MVKQICTETKLLSTECHRHVTKKKRNHTETSATGCKDYGCSVEMQGDFLYFGKNCHNHPYNINLVFLTNIFLNSHMQEVDQHY